MTNFDNFLEVIPIGYLKLQICTDNLFQSYIDTKMVNVALLRFVRKLKIYMTVLF